MLAVYYNHVALNKKVQVPIDVLVLLNFVSAVSLGIAFSTGEDGQEKESFKKLHQWTQEALLTTNMFTQVQCSL